MNRRDVGRLAWYVVEPFLAAFGVGVFFGFMFFGGMVALGFVRALGCTS